MICSPHPTSPTGEGPIFRLAHRLLAPRIAFLIGSRDPAGEPNLIPVSNVTSVSTDPQLVLVAIYKRWKTYANFTTAQGFTLSVPTYDQMEGVWKLGARYSRYEYPGHQAKLRECGLALSMGASPFGPVLADGLGWLACHIVERMDVGGDHGMFVGEIDRVAFDDSVFELDGTPRGDFHPLMQVTGNRFATTGATDSIPYGPGLAEK